MTTEPSKSIRRSADIKIAKMVSDIEAIVRRRLESGGNQDSVKAERLWIKWARRCVGRC